MGLKENIATETANGWRVESILDGQAVLVKGSKPNHILHLILFLVTAGFWLPVWIFIAVTGGEKRKVIS